MSRPIFQAPIPYTNLASRLEFLITVNNGLLNDTDLAEALYISERDVRTIVECLNTNKYIGINNKYLYKKVNKHYTVIDINYVSRERVIKKLKLDMLAMIKRSTIQINKISNVNLMNMTLEELMEVE